MDILVALMIPVLFLGAGIVLLLVSQVAGFLQFQQYYRRHRFDRALMSNYVEELAAGDVLLYERARELEALASQLQDSNERLQGLDRMKSKFFSMAVHDLRNPLQAIGGFAELLAKQVERPQGKEMLARIHSSAQFMNGLMADLTDMALFEAGKLRVDLSRQDLRGMLKELGPRYGVLAQRRGLEFRCDTPPEPVWVLADAGRLARVFTNLLDNALKFTPRGGLIELGVREEGRWAVVRVKDNGHGIHPAEREKIFAKFYQSRYAAAEQQKQGWGLGLSIALEVVRLHKAAIGVDSKGLGKGSTFWVKVPLARKAAESKELRV